MPHLPYLPNPKSALSIANLDPPSGFQIFVKKYREKVKRLLTSSRDVIGYAVFFDADNDGDADFYLSSNVEEKGGGRYQWQLYLNESGAFRKAENRVWFRSDKSVDVAMLEPQDLARRDSFYSVSLTCGNTQIQIFEKRSNGLYSHAYERLLSAEDRNRRPLADSEKRRDGDVCQAWEHAMKDKYGYHPPKDFRELVNVASRIERIVCKEFSEE